MAKTEVRDRYKPERVLESWRDLMEAIPFMNEDELRAALLHEVSKDKEDRRADIVVRLHRRYTRVRQEREMEEFLT